MNFVYNGNGTSYFDVLDKRNEIKRQIDEILEKDPVIDTLILGCTHYPFLRGVIERFHGGPVGLEAIASSIGEEPMTLEDVYEPYLMQLGFITRTPRGRMATPLAYEHLGYEYINN